MRISHLHRVYLLALLLLSNALMPLTATAENSNKVLLCTSAGYKWVEIDTQTQTNNAQGKHCVACLGSDDELELALESNHLSSILLSATADNNWILKTNLKARLLSRANPRAPPLFL